MPNRYQKTIIIQIDNNHPKIEYIIEASPDKFLNRILPMDWPSRNTSILQLY